MSRIAVNPYLPSYEYVPDGEPHVFGDRLYIFGSHDRFGGACYCMNDYVCWSAPVDDLGAWRYEGLIYRRAQDPTPVGPMQHYMWAPDVTRGADGRYYLYYITEWLNRVGVAVCDTPAGRYEFYGEVRYADGTRYGGRPGEPVRFDPAVLADEGRYYLYTGFSADWMDGIAQARGMTITDQGSMVVELAPDMLTVKGEARPLLPGKGNSAGTGFEGHEFFEASSMRKFGDTYYAVYSSVRSHELCYAASDRPDGGFVYGGVLHSNGNVFGEEEPTFYWGNNHGSLVRVGGEYYVFGHRQTHRNEASRQGVAERIEWADGQFRQAEMTSQGLFGRPLPASGTYEAGIACYLRPAQGIVKITETDGEDEPYITQDGPDRECDPAQYVANMADGTVCGYRYFAVPEGGAVLTLTVRPHEGKTADGVLEIAADTDFTAPQSAAAAGEKVRFDLAAAEKTALYIRYRGAGAIDLLTLSFVPR